MELIGKLLLMQLHLLEIHYLEVQVMESILWLGTGLCGWLQGVDLQTHCSTVTMGLSGMPVHLM